MATPKLFNMIMLDHHQSVVLQPRAASYTPPHMHMQIQLHDYLYAVTHLSIYLLIYQLVDLSMYLLMLYMLYVYIYIHICLSIYVYVCLLTQAHTAYARRYVPAMHATAIMDIISLSGFTQ